MAMQTASAPAQSTESTLRDHIDAATADLAKADAAVARLRSEVHSMPGRVRATLAEAADGGEAARATAEQRLVALRERRTTLPALIVVAECIAASAEVALRDLEGQAASGAAWKAVAKERALAPPPGVLRINVGSGSSRQGALVHQAAARRASAQQASQTAAERLAAAKQRLAAALSAALE